MKVYSVLLNCDDFYDGWTVFVGVYTNFDKVRVGVHEHAAKSDYVIEREYHPQLGDYKGENPEVLMFETNDGYGTTLTYETMETELDLTDGG